MLKKIRDIIFGSKVPLENIYNEFCTDKLQKKMSQTDFKKFVKKYVDKAVDQEIIYLFRHFVGNNAFAEVLTFDDFRSAFGREVSNLSSNVICSIEDIIKPLVTKIKKYNVNPSELFDKYDKNKNKRLSAQELAVALRNDMRIELAEEEVQAIKEYFKNRHNSLEIGELDFITLLNTKFQRLFDESSARSALIVIKQKVY
jgi:hypothetical protein